MTLPTWATARVIAMIVGGLLLVVALWWVVSSLAGGKHAEVQAKLNANIAGAALDSGHDATNTVGQVGERQSQTDQLTKEDADAIKSALGADVKLAPPVHAAGIRGLCKRAAYRLDPQCLRPVNP